MGLVWLGVLVICAWWLIEKVAKGVGHVATGAMRASEKKTRSENVGTIVGVWVVGLLVGLPITVVFVLVVRT